MRLKKYSSGWVPLLGLGIIALVLWVVPQAVKYQSKAGGVNANLVVDYLGVLGTMPKPWRNLGQGGEEAKPMLGPVIDAVKNLKPEYIRIDHIYDAFDVVGRNGDGLTYNWEGLDKAVGEIVATGAKPFLSLSYMPPELSGGDIVSPARNWSEWGEVVKATIEHYSGRNQKNIDGVIYEVWNEPDLFGGYKTYGPKNYLDMYAAAARAAASVRGANLFEIGGPATTGLYQNWLETLIKFVDRNNLRMDFVSWHRYSYDLDVFEKDADTARAWAAKIPALINLKFYVTEWGQNSEVDPTYDGKMGAIHAIAASRVMMKKIDRAFAFEIKDGPGNSKYWGRWGLLTHEKWGEPEKKPRYYAFQLLNSLGQYRMSLEGEGSWVKGIASTDDSGMIKLLVVNYDETGKHTEAVPITFENLPNGNFTLSRQDFLGGLTTIKVATTEAKWKTTQLMPPNSAAMFTVQF